MIICSINYWYSKITFYYAKYNIQFKHMSRIDLKFYNIYSSILWDNYRFFCLILPFTCYIERSVSHLIFIELKTKLIFWNHKYLNIFCLNQWNIFFNLRVIILVLNNVNIITPKTSWGNLIFTRLYAFCSLYSLYRWILCCLKLRTVYFISFLCIFLLKH